MITGAAPGGQHRLLLSSGVTASRACAKRVHAQAESCWQQESDRAVDDQVGGYGGVLVVDDDLVMVEVGANLKRGGEKRYRKIQAKTQVESGGR